MTGIGLALIANHKLSVQRDIVLNQVEPALHDALDLETALVNEETGVRGYIITAKPESLQPYYTGPWRRGTRLRQARRAGQDHRRDVDRRVQAVRAASQAWQLEFAQPALRKVHTGHSPVAANVKGKALFDALRVSLGRLQADSDQSDSTHARQQLEDDASFLQIVLLIAAALILGSRDRRGLSCCGGSSRARWRSWARSRAGRGAGISSKPVASPPARARSCELGGEIDAMRERIVRRAHRRRSRSPAARGSRRSS